MFIIPSIALGVNYETIMGLTPFSLMPIVKGIKKRNELIAQQNDVNNYMLAIYILSGLSGKMPDQPYSIANGGANLENTNDKEKQYNANKQKFAEIMIGVNKKFERKEG